MTTQTLVQTLPFSKISFFRKLKINWKVVLLFNFCLVLALAVLYVWQVNKIIVNGYLIKSYQKQINDLLRENKNLEIEMAKISYSENIRNKAKEINFVRVQKVTYIQVLDRLFAKK